MRTLGVRGQNLPTKKAKIVKGANFAVAGVIGHFERKYKKAFSCANMEELQKIFGKRFSPATYGYDVAESFFANLDGTEGTLYVKSHVGYTGSAFDAVTAFSSITERKVATPNQTLKIEDAYQGELAFGVSGNRTGYTIETGSRFDTAVAVAGASGDNFLTLDAIVGVRIGDIVKIGNGTPIYRKVTGIDEAIKKATFDTTLGAVVALDVVVQVMGFKIRLWRKDLSGIVSEVEPDLGKRWCTMSSEVSEFYVQNVFKASENVKVTDLSSATTYFDKFPLDFATVTYLASGVDGTSASTASHWTPDLVAFNNLPVRMLGNAETILDTVNTAGEAYCKARWDAPKWVYNIPQSQNKAQLLDIGHIYQRSDEVSGVIVANWIEIADPYNNSILAPNRQIPNIGHVMGTWVRSIVTLGIHWIPAVMAVPLKNIRAIVGDTFLDDVDRTDLASAGVNVLQYIEGSGYFIRNFFTPSVTQEFKFANGILMKSYMQVSQRDSLLDTENEPNSLERIRNSAMAIYKFYYTLWNQGSNGTSPEGETFGQWENEDGSATKPNDHFQIQADILNNPQININDGERNLDSWFTYPTPAGSIRIGVGFMLR